MSDPELILKEDNAYLVASRNFLHRLNGILETADKDLGSLRDFALKEVRDEGKLDEAYPPDMFSRHRVLVDKINGKIEELALAGAPPKAIAHELSKHTNAIIDESLAIAAEGKGTSKLMDTGLDLLISKMYDHVDVSGFLKTSMNARTAKLQALLGSPSPSDYTTMLRIDDVFKQKDLIRRAVDYFSREIEAAEEVKQKITNLAVQIEDAVGELIGIMLHEPAMLAIKGMFVDNEAREILLTTATTKVEQTLLDKLPPKVWKELANLYPSITEY